ncbi:MAG: cardiolipin synthase B [Betaproteobacteria bacterium RIFCSPLOWO2_02_FULL_65_24]|nr:MAG: cardiolipin synthase B [Betaproteobacteria bacterium RIFCSPLOWO2_02_FULL_65_24]OGA73964.1 MAG: cardiolipin synthase B [Betaproteobacteria bacterium RIFCSPLOWO2_12_FULL_66_14]
MVRYLEGNRLQLLRSGAEYFPALEREIAAARLEVRLESYIYAGDETGRRITEVLCNAARRGVAVYVVVDGFGASDMPAAFREQLTEAGARVLVFRPELSRFRFRRHRLRRMHRKLAVIDARVAFIGGINVIDDDPPSMPARHDYAVKVQGPLLGPIHRDVERLWSQVAWVSLRRRWRAERRIAADTSPAGTQRAAYVVRDNIRHRNDIEEAYLAAIDAAREEIIIAAAYFFPGLRFRRALVRAAQRGVRVALLLQGRVEYLLQHYASRALYGSLLDAGVEIHEYHKSFLHAKVAVVDGLWTTVGSSNIDPFSLMLAREANIVASDVRFGEELRASLHQAMEEGAQLLPLARWLHRPWWERMPIWIAYGIARALMGITGYGAK